LAVICAKSEKHHTAFVKVVEGSEIYNFPIYHFVHFYSKFLRKTHSKQGTLAQWWLADAAPRRTMARCCLGTRASRLPEGATRLSNALHPENVLCSAPPYDSAHCSAVGWPSHVRERPETPPSVHRAMPGAHVAYKGVAAPCLTCRATGHCLCSPPPPSMAAAAKPRPH
jgi:hypothetical protein